jgi:hypothetical protein
MPNSRTDAFSLLDAVLADRPLTDPWAHGRGERPVYVPDYELFSELLRVPVSAGDSSESGRFAKAIDAWLASELRRAGFGSDEVWPRATRPRVLPRDIAVLLEKLPRKLADELRQRISGISAVGPSDARILGRAYDKQVDVCISRWDCGPELMISTKAQVSSFGKNLPNRFEEAYGDAGNLRGRYPLAAVGFFFVQRDTILTSEPESFERTVDMMRKLRDLGLGASNGYTATGLALVGWDNEDAAGTLTVDVSHVPDDVGAEQFMVAMVQQVLTVTPVGHHVDVREKIERRTIPVPEEDTGGG